MRIVIDTNVLISGVFFGGFPREILRAVVGQKITACATTEIINEYEEIVQEMIDRKQGHINRAILSPLNQLPRCKHSSTVLDSYVAAHSTCLLHLHLQV